MKPMPSLERTFKTLTDIAETIADDEVTVLVLINRSGYSIPTVQEYLPVLLKLGVAIQTNIYPARYKRGFSICRSRIIRF
jgi:hypothetical protein